MYVSPSAISEESLATLNLNQFEIGPSGEALEVQSTILEEVKGGVDTKEILREQGDAHMVDHTQVGVTEVQEQSQQQVHVLIELTKYPTTTITTLTTSLEEDGNGYIDPIIYVQQQVINRSNLRMRGYLQRKSSYPSIRGCLLMNMQQQQ